MRWWSVKKPWDKDLYETRIIRDKDYTRRDNDQGEIETRINTKQGSYKDWDKDRDKDQDETRIKTKQGLRIETRIIQGSHMDDTRRDKDLCSKLSRYMDCYFRFRAGEASFYFKKLSFWNTTDFTYYLRYMIKASINHLSIDLFTLESLFSWFVLKTKTIVWKTKLSI